MSGRPAGNPPPWASNANMSDPTKPWDGTPTKIMPSLGIIQAGHLPTGQPPAERENWWKNDTYQRLDNIDMLEAQNWIEPGVGVNIQGGGAGTTTGEMTCATWHYGKRLFHVYDDVNIRASSDGGYTWATETTTASTVYGGIASQGTPAGGGTTLAAGSTSGTTKLFFIGSGTSGAWSNANLVTSGFGGNLPPTYVLADPYQANTFWITGASTLASTATAPSIWKAVSVGGAAPTQTLLPGTAALGTSSFDLVAVGTANGVAATYDGVTNRIVTFDLAATTMTIGAAPTSKPITDVVWDAVDGLFVMVASNGTLCETWVSSTGTTGTWTQRASLSLVATTIATYRRAACTRGSLIIVPWNDGTNVWLALSGDAGATWENIPDPMGRHGVSNFTAAAIRRIRTVDNRLAAFAFRSAGQVNPAFGIRAGRPA